MKKSKIAKKIMSLIVALALMATLIPAGIGVVGAVGDTSKFLAAIRPIAADSIAISTAAELAAIGTTNGGLSKNYHLTCDIDLSIYNSGKWLPIGVSSPFTGTFDGQGYVIRNLTITTASDYTGLFGRIYGATIKNVGLEGTNINSASTYTGGICGYAESGTISNCYNQGGISASGGTSAYVGGICGGLSGTRSDPLIISSCYNQGAVSASATQYSAYAGGIFGYPANNGGDVSISNCFNTGNVTAASSGLAASYSTWAISSASAGGICGETPNSGIISDCSNAGGVSATSSGSSGPSDGGAYAGGICGRGRNISRCSNTGTGTGTVSASSSISKGYSHAYAGGICGYGGEIRDCYNTRNVSASDSNSSAAAGGICGYGNGTLYTYTCYSAGGVSASGSPSASAGGICGSGSANINLSNSYWNNESAQTVNGSAQNPKRAIGSQTGETGARTTAQMKDQYSFSGFDFTKVWEMVSGNYPQLRPYVPPTYTVTVSSSGTGATGGGNYEQGETVNISAGTAPAGKQFKNWTATGVSLANAASASTSFIMPANAVTVTATFEDIPTTTYTVTVSSAGTGASGGGSYAAGGQGDISAGTAPAGKQFKNWTATGGASLANANSASTSFTMPANAVTVTAVFEDIPTTTYAVTVSAGAGASGGGSYAAGAKVDISAGTAPAGKRFKNWTATGVTLANAASASTSFTMPANAVTVTATFEDIPANPPTTTYAVTVSAGTGATGGGSYAAGAKVNISAGTAPAGKRFKNWTATGGASLANANSASTSFTMPANAVTVTAIFEDIPANSSEKGYVLGNAKIGIGDAQLAFRAALKLVTLTDDQLSAADIDGNGRVDMSDAMRIFRYALGLSKEL